jgi:hypothetical protein
MPNNSKPADEAGRHEAPLPPLVSSPLMLAGFFFLSCGAFLLYTLVLEEDYVVYDKALAASISVPTVIGLTLVAIAVKRSRRR